MRLPTLPKLVKKRVRVGRVKFPKEFKGGFKWPHPLRKPPRLKGKTQNRGIKNK